MPRREPIHDPSDTTPATTAGPADTDQIPRHVKAVIALLLAATFVVILNETLLAVALTPLMEALDVTASTAQWLTTAFMLTMAVVIPMTGAIIDRFTTRAVYFAAMVLFALGTLVAALSPGFEVLLAGRIIQASGTALMMPLLMTTIMTFVPASRRGAMMGLATIVISVAPAIGPTVSGLIVDSLSWRWLFVLTLPLSVAALVVGHRLVTNIGESRPARFDLFSVLLSAIAFGGLVYGLSSIGAASQGDVPVQPRYPLIIGALALAGFVVRQFRLQRRDSALLDLRAFGSRTFTMSLVQMVIVMASLFGAIILLPIYTQEVLHFSTLKTGLLMLPGGLAMGICGPIVGRVYDRVGPGPLVLPGALCVSAAMWAMTRLDGGSHAGYIVGVYVVLSVGLGLMMTPLFTSGLGSLPMQLYSHGSAILATLQQLAGAAGTALFITLLATGATDAAKNGATEAAARIAGVNDAFTMGAYISLAAIVLALFARRPRRRRPGGEAPVGVDAAGDAVVPSAVPGKLALRD